MQNSNTNINMQNMQNVIYIISVFSPIILGCLAIASSFICQNFKGIIYIAFLLLACIIRNYVYILNGKTDSIINNPSALCSKILYSKTHNSTFSIFIFAFTILYLLIPMIYTNNINFWLLSGLIGYFLLDIFIKINKQCIHNNAGNVIINIITGSVSAGVIVLILYLNNLSEYLFYNKTMKQNEPIKCVVSL